MININLIDLHSDSAIIQKYFTNLVNHFFKILPMWENRESTICSYIESLQCELSGCKSLLSTSKCEHYYITLLSILQFLIDTPDCSQRHVKREVFKAISICNKISSLIIEGDED